MTKRNLIWVAAFLIAAVAMSWATRRPAPPMGTSLPGTLASLDEAREIIRNNSYRPVEDKALIHGGLAGLAAAVDEYSSYIPPDKVDSFQRRMEGRECGVGLRLEKRQGRLRTLKIAYGSPSRQAGLSGGEVILEVDGRPVAGRHAPEVERLINDGPAGSRVTLKIIAPNGRPRTLILSRHETPVESVVGLFRREDGQWIHQLRDKPAIAYFRIQEFLPDTTEQLQAGLREMDAMSAMVLDLRDNPGGRLPSAVDVADLFLREGPIVTVVSRTENPRVNQARADGTLPDNIRVVVLVNEETASAAEIVAGALQAAGRALLVGTRTRGKNAIQSMIPLPGGLGQLNLTTGEFVIGLDRSINRQGAGGSWGIDPDLELPIPPDELDHLEELRETAALPPPASDGRHKTPATLTAMAAPNFAESLIDADPQLNLAVELLDRGKDFDAVLDEVIEARKAASTQPATNPTQPQDGR
jgi:carboxyl-terminal processing protease